ncbi:hypothetical protein FRC14_004996 [Serendipita sp. 396]|nr:hypothetical protein FRC14_004996 [Serendipita sp. 396]KAG8866303.1 hypothetical protein FRC20_008853 [Serendipita sp. 405]
MNSNHVLIGNGRLPFEVLAQVFNYYLEHETAAQPLETLLLVCKAWNEAACGRPSLWATYKIRLEEERTKKRWLYRLPLRLRRSGSHTPLHIDIASPENPPDLPFHNSVSINDNMQRSIDSYYALELLNILAGNNGSLCARWKSLRLLLAFRLRIESGKEDTILPLTYSMPALKSLHLSLYCRYSELVPQFKRRELFPELPFLEFITLEPFHLENYPDMSHARNITFHSGWALEGRRPQKGLYNAPYVEVLSIFFSDFFFALPEVYPLLRKLFLTGPKLFSRLLGVSMPRLEELIIQYSHHVVLEQAANLRDIDRIHTIRLNAAPNLQLAYDRQIASRAIGALLTVCTGLQTLKADDHVLSLLLKDWKQYLQPTSPLHVFLTKASGEEMKIVVGDINPISEWNAVTK